jgi:hypothetical protein
MRIWPTLIAFTCLSGCAAANPPPPVPPPPDINSDEFKEWAAARHKEDIQKAAQSKDIVTQKFYVGWEMHFGYFLEPVDTLKPDTRRPFPEFINERVEAQFDAMDPSQNPKMVICECTGVWFSGDSYFLVREAKFELRD